MTVSDDVEAYKRAYSDFFQEVQPIVSRGSAGGIVVRPVHGEPFRMRVMEMRMMTGLYRELAAPEART